MARKIVPKGANGRLSPRKYAALARNITRRQVAARRVSMGGKGG